MINAVSKSGNNSFHGSAFDFLRDSKLDAPTPSPCAPTHRRSAAINTAAAWGGPVKRDKAFFCVDYIR